MSMTYLEHVLEMVRSAVAATDLAYFDAFVERNRRALETIVDDWPNDRYDLVLLGCGGKKASGKRSALEMYTGPVFQAHLAFLRKLHLSPTKILSAEHGIINPSQEIRPYEATLDDPKTFARYNASVVAFLTGWRKPNCNSPLYFGEPPWKKSRLLVLAGAKYVDGWVNEARACGWIVDDPLRGFTALQRRALETYVESLPTVDHKINAPLRVRNTVAAFLLARASPTLDDARSAASSEASPAPASSVICDRCYHVAAQAENHIAVGSLECPGGDREFRPASPEEIKKHGRRELGPARPGTWRFKEEQRAAGAALRSERKAEAEQARETKRAARALEATERKGAREDVQRTGGPDAADGERPQAQSRGHWLAFWTTNFIGIKGPPPNDRPRPNRTTLYAEPDPTRAHMSARGFEWSVENNRYQRPATKAAWASALEAIVALTPGDTWAPVESKTLQRLANMSAGASNWAGPGGPTDLVPDPGSPTLPFLMSGSIARRLARLLKTDLRQGVRLGGRQYSQAAVEFSEAGVEATYDSGGDWRLIFVFDGVVSKTRLSPVHVNARLIANGTTHESTELTATIGEVCDLTDFTVAEWFNLPTSNAPRLSQAEDDALKALQAEEAKGPNASWLSAGARMQDRLVAKGFVNVLENESGGFPYYKLNSHGRRYLLEKAAK